MPCMNPVVRFALDHKHYSPWHHQMYIGSALMGLPPSASLRQQTNVGTTAAVQHAAPTPTGAMGSSGGHWQEAGGCREGRPLWRRSTRVQPTRPQSTVSSPHPLQRVRDLHRNLGMHREHERAYMMSWSALVKNCKILWAPQPLDLHSQEGKEKGSSMGVAHLGVAKT